MDLKASIGWFAVLLAAACAMVGLVALYAVAVAPASNASGPDDLMVPITMLFLKPIAFATMAAAAVGLFWPSKEDAGGHNLRCWLSLIAGGVAGGISLLFGPAI